ncbi:MAG: hypothetical protein WA659_00615 [Candidatus Aquirickettsiella sp.]
MPLTKKQNDYPTIPQLYWHFKSTSRTSRDIFQTTLHQLSSKPFAIATALGMIHNKDILNLENFSLIFLHPSPLEIASGLIQLHDSNLLNPKNKKALEKHTCPSGVALVLRLLHSVKLLTPENRTAIQEKNDLHSIAGVFFKLYYADLFIQKNFNHVLEHHPATLNNLLRGFDRQNILTQKILEQLMHSQQKKNSWSNGYTEAKKLSIPTKSSPYLATNYNCCSYANFFSSHKYRYEQEHHIKTFEFNSQINKK